MAVNCLTSSNQVARRRRERSAAHLPPAGVEDPIASARSSPRAPLLPALAIICPRGAVWRENSAKAFATLRRSWRKNCLSRRSRRLRAALDALASPPDANMKFRTESNAT